MNLFSLRALIDDILLIVRNNNISESEDFSRALIASWVLAYKAFLNKEQLELKKEAANDPDWFDESTTSTEVIGPLELEVFTPYELTNILTRITKEEISGLYNDDPKNIIAVFDLEYHPIQFMHGQRRHFHYFRKYTSHELTYDYVNKHIVISGNCEFGKLKYIFVKLVKGIDGDDANMDEDDVQIPGWMIPRIKELIFKNELAFMVRMPSDDDNNSTLDGIKPGSPQQTSRSNNEK